MQKFICSAVFATTMFFSANAQNVSEDLLMHDLVGGNVKRYVIMPGSIIEHNFNDKEYETSWTYFDTEGRVLRDGIWMVFVYDANGRYVRGQFLNATMERNERGHIKRLANGELGFFEAWYNYEYQYNEFGKKVVENYDTPFSSGTITYVYDADNELVSSHTEYDAEGNQGTIDYTYSIVSRDNYGNWTERKVHRVEKEIEDGKVMTTTSEDSQECRQIEYYGEGERSVDAEKFILPVVVKGTNVRLRLGPSTNHQILSKGNKPVYPRKGERMKYLGETDDFYHVEYKDAQVYISKKFCEREL